MDRQIVTACFILTVFLAGDLRAQSDLSPREIADRSFKATKLRGAEAVSNMTIIDGKGRERVRRIAQVSKLVDGGKTEKRLIRFLSPADVKGTGLLVFDYEDRDDDMWLYMPALRKTRRIVSSEKAKSFMGSEFSYADITPPTLDDFTFHLLGKETVDGLDCWKIEMTPRDEEIADEIGFSKRISYIRSDILVLKKAVYYDVDGELHKELVVEEIREMDPENHKYRPIHMHMTNLQNNRKSILIIEEIAFKPDVAESYFTTRYLERE